MKQSNESGAITHGNLLMLIGDVAVQVVDLEIHEEPGRHGRLLVTVMAEEAVKEYILHEGEGAVSLLYLKEESLNCLFRGTVRHMKVAAAAETYYIHLEAETGSFRMDIDKDTLSFQDTAMTSHQLFAKLMEFYPGSQILLSVPDQPMGRIALQYQETFWEFLKRMASAYGAQLFADSTSQTIRIRMGLWEEEEPTELEDSSYTIIRNTAPKEVDRQLKEQMIYQTETYEILPLGAGVRFLGQKLYVGHIDRTLKDGLLVNQYRLYFKEGLQIRKYYNPLISGISVDGAVTGIQRNQVQVQMATDALTDCQSQYYFPFSTVAASADGSGWYCMPKAGDPVRIFFPVSDEKEGYAISNIQGQSTPSAGDPMENPDLKDITTPDGKTVKFIENGILLAVGGGKGTITLTNDGKAEIKATEDIEIGAAQMVTITTEGELKLTANVEIQFTSDAGSGVTVTDNEVAAKGSRIINN